LIAEGYLKSVAAERDLAGRPLEWIDVRIS
jgi:hypothetical protein